MLAALDTLDVPETRWEEYLTRVLLALPGWAGMVNRLEHNPADRPLGRSGRADGLPRRAPRAGAACAARRGPAAPGLRGLPLGTAGTRPERAPPAGRPGAPGGGGSWRFFQLAQLAGLSAPEVATLPLSQRRGLLASLEAFDEQSRRQVWQEADQHHYRMEVLHGLDQNRRRPEPLRTVRNARFQVVLLPG